MQDYPLLSLSVQALAEYCTAKGDISAGAASAQRMNEGTIAHQKIQKQNMANAELQYQKEVSLSLDLQRNAYTLRLSGRADGIYLSAQGMTTIQEIKSTYLPAELITQPISNSHFAQMSIYAYLYGFQNGLENLAMCLTYYSLSDQKEVHFHFQKTLEVLQAQFISYIEDYCLLADQLMADRIEMIRSAGEMVFPFSEFRPFQRDASAQVFTAIKNGSTLFLEAPTGIGKTIATLFPAVKALGQGLCEKIFYLTAKNQTAMVASEVLIRMRQQGLQCKSLMLTAKEKSCLQETVDCDPLLCPYAANFFSKLHDALPEIARQQEFNLENIQAYAKQYMLCPHELSLSLAELCDCVICDYNYVFDPLVKLKRFFTLGGSYLFLVDEAHNLVDRSREMFSTAISKEQIRFLRTKCRPLPKLYKALGKLNTVLNALYKQKESDVLHLTQPPKEILSAIRSILGRVEEYAMIGQPLPNDAWLEMKEILLFDKISELYKDEYYATYADGEEKQFALHLFCLQPSFYLREALNKGRAAVLFSATLTPYGFYAALLGGDEKTYSCILPSPFPHENLLVCADYSIHTTYKARADYYQAIASRILCACQTRKGNYLVFFPSFDHMRKVAEILMTLSFDGQLLVHQPSFDKSQREAFLAAFRAEQSGTLIGLTVLGSHFGEGIDLPGDALSGAVIVGVGLPQVCLQRELLKEYFDQTFQSGFAFSYVYPGMNKVSQAGGRVIRTAEDRGFILLLDHRFSRTPYHDLLPDHWNIVSIKNEQHLCALLSDFWNQA